MRRRNRLYRLFNLRPNGRPISRNKIIAAFVFAALFIACGFFVSRNIVKNVKEYTAWVDRSREVIAGFEVLQNDFKSSLIYSRRYDSLLHEPLLQQYQMEMLHTQAQLVLLRRLAGDNPQQIALLNSIDTLLKQQLPTLMEKNLAEITEAGESFRYRAFAEITALIKQGITKEEKLLLLRKDKLNKSTQALTYSLTAVTSAIILTFLFLIFYISYKRNLLQGFLGSVLDSTSNTIISYKPVFVNGEVADFAYVYINKTGLRDYHVTEAEVLETTLNKRMRGSGTDLLPHFKQVYQTGKPASFEIVFTRGGPERYIWASITREGNSLTGCFNEITAQKKAEMALSASNATLQKTNSELQTANEELARFIHVSSHDLKEPVRKAALFTDRLLHEDSSLSQNAKYLAGKVQAAHQVMTEMIEGVLRYSAITKVPPEMGPVSLNGVMKQVEKELESIIKEKSATFHYEDLPVIKGDEHMLRQLMYQLVHNALKFSRDGLPQTVSIRAETLASADHTLPLSANGTAYCRIVVRDEGIGLSSENTKDIFSPFVRQHPKDKYNGAGLGLALCKKIVELHGGTIHAENEEGGGAVFTLVLPKA